MTGIIIAITVGWLGGYRFYKGQIGLGVLYLLTGGLVGIGWIVDIAMSISEYNKSKKSGTAKNDDSAMITNVVGTFAECRKNEAMRRKDIISKLNVGSELALETAYWEGKPFFLVVDSVSGLDIGALPKENSGFLKSTYPNARFKAVLIEKDLDNPVIRIDIAQ